MIISDDVYGTLVDNFHSLLADLPFNSIGVYSFSKYFGVTGWRLGTIAINENNIFDKLIRELPSDKIQELRHRYEAISTNPPPRKAHINGLGLELAKNPYDAAYYTQFDMLEWAIHHYGNQFGEYLQENYKPVDILYRLADESSIVLLGVGGFHGPEWAVRISLANLNDESYSSIGEVLHRILKGYADLFESDLVPKI